MNIVSLITCRATGLSYVGVTKNGRRGDPANFSPLRYGFGPRFVEALKRFGADAFTVQILGHGYETRAELCEAQREFIDRYHTLWPRGYNVLFGHESHIELDDEWAEEKSLRILQSPLWREANAAAANRRKQTQGWRDALKRRSKNVIWRQNISAARLPYLHRRWHVERGLVPDGTTVEDCAFCEAVILRKRRRLLHQRKAMRLNLPPALHVNNEQPAPRIPVRRRNRKPELPTASDAISLEQDIRDMARRVNEMFWSRE